VVEWLLRAPNVAVRSTSGVFQNLPSLLATLSPPREARPLANLGAEVRRTASRGYGHQAGQREKPKASCSYVYECRPADPVHRTGCREALGETRGHLAIQRPSGSACEANSSGSSGYVVESRCAPRHWPMKSNYAMLGSSASRSSLRVICGNGPRSKPRYPCTSGFKERLISIVNGKYGFTATFISVDCWGLRRLFLVPTLGTITPPESLKASGFGWMGWKNTL
jgi:hypothetical protein